MYRVVYTPQAEDQLLALFAQIALAASPEIAARYTDAIVQQCESLSTFPMRGAQRDDLYPGLRVFGFRRRASIAFEVAGDLVKIAGIFYGGQNLETAFEE
ncbi:MAG TPA: type II toxin-antitoxin system RelE/ParE family toxin [Terracidiphilus sp.]|nr:type II toxin-antitoxin system RelE/ParE family toxin [Terracidiphilus sp.]